MTKKLIVFGFGQRGSIYASYAAAYPEQFELVAIIENAREHLHGLPLALALRGEGDEILHHGVFDLVFDGLVGRRIGRGAHVHAQILRLRAARALRRKDGRQNYYE